MTQTDDAARLRALAEVLRVLKAKALATQKELETATGVDQTTISRIMNGHRRRFSSNLMRLESYANMLTQGTEIPVAVQEATKEFLVVGTETELIASIKLARQLVAGRLR
jgi:transcriptional regulator with XRE-family HTH domain